MATRKTTTKTESSAPKRAATPRKTAKTIRNRTSATVHLRLFSQNPKDPYRIALSPRGDYGDTTSVPATLIDDPTFLAAIGFSIEVITPAEANEIRSHQQVGYLGRTDAPTIVRPDDSTVMSAPDWDGKGRLPQDREVKRTPAGKQASEREFSTGMHTADVPGSDSALHAMLEAQAKAGSSAMPAEATFDRRVVIERAKG